MRVGGQLIQKMQLAWKRKILNAEKSSQVGLRLQILLCGWYKMCICFFCQS